jgi:membrane protein implicated in regulation of membrane protease activity
MFFPFAAAAIVAIALLKLGGLTVLSLVLSLVFVVGLVLAWRQYKQHRTNGGE